jgi:hypothetical protein
MATLSFAGLKVLVPVREAVFRHIHGFILPFPAAKEDSLIQKKITTVNAAVILLL